MALQTHLPIAHDTAQRRAVSRSHDDEARSARQDQLTDLGAGELIDTGQVLDTGQEIGHIDTGELMQFAFSEDKSLTIEHHEIHRTDETEGGRELVTSTLKAFQFRVAVRSADGADCSGGILCASLLYEDGGPVQELSATLEPPLLGGRAVVEDGVATFRLRITVLSSLCHAKRFRVHVYLAEHPEVCVTSSAVKTITKLRRGSREAREAAREAREARERATAASAAAPSLCGGKRALGVAGSKCCDFEEEAVCEASKAVANDDDDDAYFASRTIDELWDEIHTNGAKLLELQRVQRDLFKRLRAFRQMCEPQDEAECEPEGALA